MFNITQSVYICCTYPIDSAKAEFLFFKGGGRKLIKEYESEVDLICEYRLVKQSRILCNGVHRKPESMFMLNKKRLHSRLSLKKSILCLKSWQERIPPSTSINADGRGRKRDTDSWAGERWKWKDELLFSRSN